MPIRDLIVAHNRWSLQKAWEGAQISTFRNLTQQTERGVKQHVSKRSSLYVSQTQKPAVSSAWIGDMDVQSRSESMDD